MEQAFIMPDSKERMPGLSAPLQRRGRGLASSGTCSAPHGREGMRWDWSREQRAEAGASAQTLSEGPQKATDIRKQGLISQAFGSEAALLATARGKGQRGRGCGQGAVFALSQPGEVSSPPHSPRPPRAWGMHGRSEGGYSSQSFLARMS